MVKNGSKKRRLIRSVNFGEPGDLSRELIEIYERKVGKNKLSKLVRDSVIAALSKDKTFENHKVNMIINKRKELMSEMKMIQAEILHNADLLEKMGVDVNDL